VLVVPIASVTDSLVTLATHIIRDLGLGGVGLLTATSGVILVPGTEPTMLFAGFNVFQHHLSLLGIIVLGAVGDIVGACIAYAIGYFASDLLATHGHKIHVGPERLAIANRFFERWGFGIVLVSRWFPLIRALFPYAAGVGRMSFRRFLPLAALGSVVWIAALGILGRAVGSSWPSWRHNLEYVDYAFLALLVCAIAYLILRRRVRRPARDAVA
jgi:membrane protein DedA with SNARE-associated domain